MEKTRAIWERCNAYERFSILSERDTLSIETENMLKEDKGENNENENE